VNKQLKIYNGRILTPFRIIEGGTVLVTDDRITAVSDKDIAAPDAVKINAGGKFVSPGFIDMHVHGGGGYDFMDNTVAAFLGIAETHAHYGITSMLPTTLSSKKEDLLQTLRVYDLAHKENKHGARFLGLHLEGPYFAMNQRGAQDPKYIRDPDPQEYLDILSHSGHIRRWSIAPELNGAMALVRCLRSRRILPSMGHTDAIYEEVLEAFENGCTLATHFYCAMSGITRRDGFRYAGVIESGFLIDGMDVEIIADGIHLPPPLLKLVYKIKGADRTALVTDAMRGAGMPPGESILGSLHDGVKVIVEDGVAKLPDRSAFAGSVATADRLVRNMVTLAQVPLPDAVRMITSTPARIMGMEDRIGALAPGMDADIVIFDEDIRIDTTIIKGEIVYTATQALEMAGSR
jgi:N-acetylglucosamine-6-phosphate deacetylase